MNIQMMRTMRQALTTAILLICCATISPRLSAQQSSALTQSAISQRVTEGRLTRIVCFGDSITGVYYHSGSQRAWCDMLGLAIQKASPAANVQMINAGISGHTTVNALARIDRDVIAKKPHLVVVMFGMNDVTRVPLDSYAANMREIVQRCQKAGANVVLCTPNAVSENAARPEVRLAKYAEVVRSIADESHLSLVDFFADWQTLREKDPVGWSLIMSDAIHPNMNGHVRFAELIGAAVCGRSVSLSGLSVPSDTMHHTFDRLSDKQRVKLVAAAPYDQLFPQLLQQYFPDASFDVTVWPASGKSVTEMAEWAKRIRGLKPDLVVPNVPLTALDTDPEKFIPDYEWMLNRSFQFAGRPWDVVPVLPLDIADLSQTQKSNYSHCRRITIGKDVRFIERAIDSEQSPSRIAAAWIAEQHQAWQGQRNLLPTANGRVLVPTQSWAHRPGPRSVRVSVSYPGGRLENVNKQTGIMLTLHNWGGEDCAGTANPNTLADRLNVIALCVNYLQSGRKDSIESPEPYDCGYLQAIDALRSLAWIRNGLKQSSVTFDDRRIFCTGGSGGGNVTLMANKLAPRTFACIIDMCGMKKLSDDIAFNEPGGSGLNARWSRDSNSLNYLSADAQEIRFAAHPQHLAAIKKSQPSSKIIVVHGRDDTTCLFADAEELVTNLRVAKFDVEEHFIGKDDLDGKAFTSSGHSLGNRTEIVMKVAGRYLSADSPDALRRTGPTDFDRKDVVQYETRNGRFLISYTTGIPIATFVPAEN